MITIKNIEYLDPVEAAQKLNLHKNTLLRFAKEGKIKSFRQSSKRIYFSEDEIEKFLKGGE